MTPVFRKNLRDRLRHILWHVRKDRADYYLWKRLGGHIFRLCYEVGR